MKPLIILGDGDHARVLVDMCLSLEQKILGVTSLQKKKGTPFFKAISILGDDTVLQKYSPDEVYLLNGLGSVGKINQREYLFEKTKSLGFSFFTFVHPSAFVSSSARLSEGVQVFPGCVIMANSTIEENVLINTCSSIDHDCRIGKHSHIAPGTTICGNVFIGEASHVSCGVTIINNIEIGARSFVAAGAVVTKSFSPGSVLRGVPASIYDSQIKKSEKS